MEHEPPRDARDAAPPARFARQTALPQVGAAGQRRLAAARMLVIGAGGLGGPAATALVASGVGTVAIVDDDTVEESNLARQTLYRAGDVGRPKAATAAAALAALGPATSVLPVAERLDAGNADRLVSGYDVVLDGSDDYRTRRAAHDAALAAGIPYVWGSALGWDGQVTVFAPARPGSRGARLEDLFPPGSEVDPADSCAAAGVFGPVCAAIGALMAAEALKLVLGAGDPLIGRLAVLDALDGTWREVAFAPGPVGPGAPTSASAPAAGGAGPAEAGPARAERIDPPELARLLREREEGRAEFLLVDIREPWERELVRLPGSQGVPMGTLLASAEAGMDAPEEPVVLYCHHGVRSEATARRLSELGWDRVTDLRGGIAAWTETVDPGLPRY